MGADDVAEKLTLHNLQVSREDDNPVSIRAAAPDVNSVRVLEVHHPAQCSMLSNGSPVSFAGPINATLSVGPTRSA